LSKGATFDLRKEAVVSDESIRELQHNQKLSKETAAMEQYTGFSGHASLPTVGMWMKENQIWNRIEERVKIKQKVIQHTPTDKLKDLLINILAGGHGIVEVNNRVRVDKASESDMPKMASKG
jgi:hypothetical protein